MSLPDKQEDRDREPLRQKKEVQEGSSKKEKEGWRAEG